MTHPSGLPSAKGTTERCATCAWYVQAPSSCHAADLKGLSALPVPADSPACAYHEPLPACEPCGACCREGYDAVPVELDDVILTKHPDLVAYFDPTFAYIKRVPGNCGTRCAALRGDGQKADFRCAIYEDRATACRDVAQGSPACLLARRRVSLSPTPAGAATGPRRET